MSVLLSSSTVPTVDIYVLRRDYFDGFSLLLQDADDEPYNLTNVTVCASVWKTTTSGTTEQVLSLNVEKQEPLSAGRVRFWLTSAQNATLWDTAQANTASNVFYPTAYTGQAQSTLLWDVRIETEEYLADLVSVSAGNFVTQTNHTLGSTERVIFRNTAQSTINYDGTGARIYSGLTNITYQPPYSFSIATLSGTTNAAVGGSVYRLRQDTVVTGSVLVGSTLSNCFP